MYKQEQAVAVMFKCRKNSQANNHDKVYCKADGNWLMCTRWSGCTSDWTSQREEKEFGCANKQSETEKNDLKWKPTLLPISKRWKKKKKKNCREER